MSDDVGTSSASLSPSILRRTASSSGFKRSVKCVIVGDGAVGKTSLLITYTTQAFPKDYIPTVFDNYNAIETVSGQEINLVLWDTAGQEEYARMRPLSYPQTNVFLVVYSVVSRDSLENIGLKWLPELQAHAPGVPFLLIGTKEDLRDDDDTLARLAKMKETPVTCAEGEAFAKRVGADGFLECSAMAMQGINEVFFEAIRIAITNQEQKGKTKKKKKDESDRKGSRRERKEKKSVEKAGKKKEK